MAEGNLLGTGLLSLMPVNNYLLSSIVLFTALMPHQGNAAYVLALAIIGIIIGSFFLIR